ncbi:hypothetical protein BDV34DRAFT_49103 [Aspergillus parasiticus]|uniref:Uncharacterized protein n=1 Tax=Aspergillus parasiticus TaxID=5067 RepID=A0A5N6DTG3_ASPPA|nr:hypothetical protein BDV34DRAFT_49103 [Aspergillus parasiticus]
MSTAPLRILLAFPTAPALPVQSSSCYWILLLEILLPAISSPAEGGHPENAIIVPLVIITTIDWAMWSLLYSDPSIADLHCLLDSLGLPLDGHRTVPV